MLPLNFLISLSPLILRNMYLAQHTLVGTFWTLFSHMVQILNLLALRTYVSDHKCIFSDILLAI